MQHWMSDRRRWFSLTAAISLLALMWIWLSAVPAAATSNGRIPNPRQGFLAPAIELNSLEGSEMTLASLRGRVVVVNYWASWCPPCRAEMPALEQTYQAQRDQGLEILAINATNQDSAEAAREFVAERGLSFPILLDVDGRVGARYQIRALPSTYFIDRDGIIRKVIIGGPMSEATLRSTVQQLLQEGK
jgi:thiol-disulfide isomerase/thioredoxin